MAARGVENSIDALGFGCLGKQYRQSGRGEMELMVVVACRLSKVIKAVLVLDALRVASGMSSTVILWLCNNGYTCLDSLKAKTKDPQDGFGTNRGNSSNEI